MGKEISTKFWWDWNWKKKNDRLKNLIRSKNVDNDDEVPNKNSSGKKLWILYWLLVWWL